MGLSAATLWWVIAGVLVAAELASGTFYLLMIALGTVAGAIAAHLGLGGAAQISVAAVVGGGATAIWHFKRSSAPPPPPVSENRDVNFDVGESVHVEAWGADRTARIAYRGSTWTARLAPGAPVSTGLHEVTAVEGNWLVLRPVTPP